MRTTGAMTAVLSLVALLGGGCYRPDLTGPGGFLCARAPECPAGFVCQDRVCVRPGHPGADLRVDRASDGGLAANVGESTAVAATQSEDRGIAQVGSSVVYATGPASSPMVHHLNSGVVGEVASGSRPSLASNGTDEAVAFVHSGNGWVVARTGTASWGTPVARIEGAERMLVRSGETPDAWEVVYRRASGLFHATVTCR